MKLENILEDLKPKGRTKLVNEINEIYRVVHSVPEISMDNYFKHKTGKLCSNYNLTPHQLTDITKKLHDSADKDERVLRRYMQDLKWGHMEDLNKYT